MESKVTTTKTYTIEEYLQLELTAEFKSDFCDGNIINRGEKLPNHCKITNSVGTAIDMALDEHHKDCSVYDSSAKVFVPSFNSIVYPDCMMICGEEERYKDSKAVIINPCLIIEVLSESTKEYDISGKFEGYRSVPSFKEYVLIWQTIPKVQSWYKEAEDLWRISSAFGLDKTIPLYSINCEIALKDIYRRIKNLGSKDDPKAY